MAGNAIGPGTMADGVKKNPDLLLAAIQKEEIARKRGRLKVFLGMCPGVGKTYAMLEAARRELSAGRDAVIGYIETHGRKETEALTEGLPTVPRTQMEYRGVTLTEMDLDAVLARKPQLALVDEFAHSNAAGSRHPKRYQDILELMDAGVDVFTTLNIQHVESRAEAVRQITGVSVQETVPDTTLDGAELELVDLPPDEVRARLAAGKVYVPERIRAAQENFFRPGNLAALRELALRFAAEHVGQDVLEYRMSLGITGPWKSGQRLLVAVSSSPTSASLLRWTRRLAGELHAPWLAVYVELPRPLSDEDNARLARHLALARELGAQVVTTTDDDVVRGLLRVAREQNATQLVVGKPAGWRLFELRGGSFLIRLIRESGNIDVHVIRAEGEEVPFRRPQPPRLYLIDPRGYAVAVGAVTVVTLVNLVLNRWIGYVPVSLVYLLSVIVLGVFVGRGPTLVAATLTALLWNYFFTEPRFTLRTNSATDTMLFATYFVVALAMGHLTARLRAQEAAERKREQRATALYFLIRELAKATDLPDLLAVAIREVGKTFHAEAAISIPDEADDTSLIPYFASTWTMAEKEQSVATWAYRHRHPAGRGTATLPLAGGLHVPLLAGERAVGVLSLRFRDSSPLAPAQRELLDAFSPQIALVLDRQRLRDEERQTELLAQSERLGKTLLNSVSHELRTPLAAIRSVTSELPNAGPLTPAQQTLTDELKQAAIRLNRVVRNLLDLSRLEAGHLRPNLDWHDLRDVLNAAVHSLGNALSERHVQIEIAQGMPFVKLDAALTEQILSNLLNNAAVYTPPGTPIEIHARVEAAELVLQVADRGPGLPLGNPARLFDRFQRGADAAPGGTGIGLSLVRGFAEAQGGTVVAANRPGGGALFTVRLPLVKMPPVQEDRE
jgi:two-component system sensor histidine kinase KdpD